MNVSNVIREITIILDKIYFVQTTLFPAENAIC